MANSLNARLLVGGLALALGDPGIAQNESTQREALVLEFESVTVDRSTNLFQVHRPKIRQGNLSIEADEATATSTDFSERSEWRFTGNGRIAVDTALLETASAVFTFDEGQLSRGELSGSPVKFSDFDKVRQTPIEGRARTMSYDNVARKLRMTGDVWIQRGRIQVIGCDLVYDFTAVERDTGLWIGNGPDDCPEPIRFLFERDRDDEPAAPDAPR